MLLCIKFGIMSTVMGNLNYNAVSEPMKKVPENTNINENNQQGQFIFFHWLIPETNSHYTE